MRRVFGAKKQTEPPPSIQDASDRVRTSNYSNAMINSAYCIILLENCSLIVCNTAVLSMMRKKSLRTV